MPGERVGLVWGFRVSTGAMHVNFSVFSLFVPGELILFNRGLTQHKIETYSPTVLPVEILRLHVVAEQARERYNTRANEEPEDLVLPADQQAKAADARKLADMLTRTRIYGDIMQVGPHHCVALPPIGSKSLFRSCACTGRVCC